jgi:ankyrin repeat protein
LIFHQIDSRLLNIKNAHIKTCDWLFEQPEYKNWIHTSLSSDYNGFLWIKGKPAAGKSTIMKHALLQVRKTMPTATVISFFFNARGSILERSTLGMYRSLLLQLMEIPVLQDSIARIFKKNRDRKDSSEWSINELQDAFRSAVQSLRKKRLICFIDALDECAEKDVRAMVEFLEDLAETAMSSGGFLNICLSSRHYPHITIRKALQLTVENQDGHGTDITTYVNSKFNAPSSLQTDEIKAEILKRASGVFLWVVLVVQMLNKAYDHGQVHAMRRRLNEIPDELDDLFADILTRDAESRDESILCLQWLLFAQRPLKREELYFAVLLGIDPIDSVEWYRSEISRETIDRFIVSCSKGLAEVSRAKDETVQFIHESVRDFFIYRNGLAKLHVSHAFDVTGLSHKRLAECCDYYVSEVIRRRSIGGYLSSQQIHQAACSGSLPFLQYAVLNVFRHSDTAQGCGFPQKDFLKKFSRNDMNNLIFWKDFYDAFSTGGGASYGLKTELLYILSDQNLPNLVRVLLEDGVSADAYGSFYGTAIQTAAAHGNQEVFRLLLAAGADINIPGGKHGHTLVAAIASSNEDIVLMLKDRDVEIEQGLLDKALHTAALWGNVPSMEFLLDLGSNPNINSLDESPLEAAIRNDHEAVVRLLLRRGVDKSALTTYILQDAIIHGNDSIVVQFLDMGVDQFEVDNSGWTALSYATARNAENIVQLLLERPGADPLLMARDIESSFFYAKQEENDRILQLLEEAKT